MEKHRIFTLTRGDTPKKKRVKGANYNKDSWAYWKKSVKRLSIMSDTEVSCGYIVEGKLDSKSRNRIKKVFYEFMFMYIGVREEDKLPFNYIQFNRMKEVLEGDRFREGVTGKG